MLPPFFAHRDLQGMKALAASRFAGTLAVAFTCLWAPLAHAKDYLARDDVRAFIDSMRDEHGVDSAQVERVLGEAQNQPSVIRLIGPAPSSAPSPARSYPAYRAKFLTPARIAAGTRYWNEHEEFLQRAEDEYGVPAEVILGILGVETAFGRNTGSYRVVDALATIAFDGQRRQEYFRDELKELLLLARDTGIDALSFKGSFAGAMGLPQFMPSSYRKYAVDFDGDGVPDIVGSPADAIGSIGSYMKAFGWTAGAPARVAVRLPKGREGELVSGLQRSHDVAELKDHGVKFQGKELPEGACSVIELPAPGAPSKFVAGFGNFEAITRYNRSTFYASAVLDLAEAIRAARDRDLVKLASGS
jgi:membrane-bound lytic murein transglycosylase B